MAVYVYIYSDYPESKGRKYYVGDYRGRKAYTYQVVPQLQRIFERRGYGDRTEISEEEFEEFRRRGHLFTDNRSGDRSPLYAEVEPREVPEVWRPLSDWLAGERAPAEVDWEELGASLRRVLGRGERLPESLAEAVESVETAGDRSFAELYEALRVWHIGRTWYHRADDLPASVLACAESRDWSFLDRSSEGSDGAATAAAAEYGMAGLVRESRRAPPSADESRWRAALADVLELEGDRRWSAIDRHLGSCADWYEAIEGRGDGPLRVPGGELYDLQWELTELFSGAGLHHECAAALEVDAPRGLHARFHAGCEAAAVIGLEGYPAAIEGAAVRDELRRESRGGVFADWSREGLETIGDLLVDPSSGRPSSAAPSSSAAAEFVLWELDEEIHRRVGRGWAGSEEWVYSRLRDQIVVSARASVPPRVLSAVVESVAQELEPRSVGIADGGIALWRFDEGRLELKTLAVPSERGVPVEFGPANRGRVRSAARRAREGEEDPDDRRLLREAYQLTGDLRYAALGHLAVASDVRELLDSVALREFRAAALDGWFGGARGRREDR